MSKTISIEIGVIIVIYLLLSLLILPSFIPIFNIIWQITIIFYLISIKHLRPNLKLMPTAILLAVISFLNWFQMGNHNAAGIIRSIILAPIMEEMLFRDYLYSSISGQPGKKIIISSVIFGAYHLKNIILFSPLYILRQIISGLVLGLINGFLRYRSRSLTLPIILHGFNNGVFASLYLRLINYLAAHL